MYIELIRIQIIITSFAIVSFAGGGLGNVEEKEERQGDKEKSPLSHPRQRNLRWTIVMKDRWHVGAVLIEITSRSRFWILDKSLCCRYLYLKFSHLLPNLCLQRKTLLCWSSNIPYILGNLRRVQNIPKDFYSCTNSFKWKRQIDIWHVTNSNADWRLINIIRAPRWEREKWPGPSSAKESSGKESRMNNFHGGQEACRCHPNRKHIQIKILDSGQKSVLKITLS